MTRPYSLFALLSLLWVTSASAEPPKSALFDLLVGTWDVQYEFVGRDGKPRLNRGQVSYRWILDGQALQEIWTSDAGNPEPRPFGTTLNFYDPKQQRWTALWVYPAQGQIIKVTGGDVNGTWVLNGQDDAGVLQRWSTQAVNPDSVIGRFETSNDAGKTWQQVGTNTMKRHSQ